MKAENLINSAWYMSKIVPRDLDETEGSQGRDGLFWLNLLLSEEGMDSQMLPYYNYVFFNTVVGQEDYFVPNVVHLSTLTFNIGTLRYSMYPDNRRHYFGSPRPDNVKSLPFNYYWERAVEDDEGGMRLSLYWKPQAIYQMKLKCQTALPTITDENVELNQYFDTFYQSYLIFLLARRLCAWYGVTPPQDVLDQLRTFVMKLTNLNPRDMTVSKISTYSTTDSMTYAQANLGKGWISP